MGNNLQKLEKEFFYRPVDVVAKDLIGKIIVREKDGKEILQMRIITTEAYGGGEKSSMPDPASHSHENYSGPNTGNGQELLGGNLYIAYSRSHQKGSHRQINITTGSQGDAQAVLIKECQLLYKDNIPNKEDATKGILTETKIADKLGFSDTDIGGYSMDEFGVSVYSDGELVVGTERKNVKDNKPLRFSITRLFSLFLILLLLLTLSSCAKDVTKVVHKNDTDQHFIIDEDGDSITIHVDPSDNNNSDTVILKALFIMAYSKINKEMKFENLPAFSDIDDQLLNGVPYYEKAFEINGYTVEIYASISEGYSVTYSNNLDTTTDNSTPTVSTADARAAGAEWGDEHNDIDTINKMLADNDSAAKFFDNERISMNDLWIKIQSKAKVTYPDSDSEILAFYEAACDQFKLEHSPRYLSSGDPGYDFFKKYYSDKYASFDDPIYEP